LKPEIRFKILNRPLAPTGSHPGIRLDRRLDEFLDRFGVDLVDDTSDCGNAGLDKNFGCWKIANRDSAKSAGLLELIT